MDASTNAFLEEAYELIAELEDALLALEDHPEDPELIGRVFRAMHTIKGSGAMFGYDDIAEFTHELETVFDMVREGRFPVTRELVNLTLSARDQIKQMLDASVGGAAVDEDASRAILQSLEKLVATPVETADASQSAEDVSKEDADPLPEDTDVEMTYRVRFCPDQNIFKNGANPVLLLKELSELGPCSVTARTRDIPELEKLDPEACYVSWDVVLTTTGGVNAIKDVFIFVEDDSEIRIDVIDEIGEDNGKTDYKRVGEILTERGDLSTEAIETAVKSQRRIGEILVTSKAVDPEVVDSALAEQAHVKKTRRAHQESFQASSIRVPAGKLDTLVDLVGELVTVQASLSQKAFGGGDPELVSISEEVERLTAELRDNTMGIRMLPIGATFSKFKRLVRDLSKELGKEVVLTTEGGETELDKTVIERLNDPLIHILRNSIDHGIESPEVRQAAGKNRQGIVHLSAAHSGAHVLIKVSDDGKGLDPEIIRAKVVEKGLVLPDAQLSEEEIFSQIFAPGFSTATSVTDVSGRGVGMDVVKRGIEALRGAIEIDAVKGSATTITLKLPLTLAIIDGLLVQVGTTHFVLPLSAVEECVELSREDGLNANGRRIMNIRDEIVPYVLLRELFGIDGDRPFIEQIVVAELDNHRIGFAVDRVIGEHQTVIKNLGKLYRNAQGFSGATILADGTVALILDVKGLSDVARLEERSWLNRRLDNCEKAGQALDRSAA